MSDLSNLLGSVYGGPAHDEAGGGSPADSSKAPRAVQVGRAADLEPSVAVEAADEQAGTNEGDEVTVRDWAPATSRAKTGPLDDDLAAALSAALVEAAANPERERHLSAESNLGEPLRGLARSLDDTTAAVASPRAAAGPAPAETNDRTDVQPPAPEITIEPELVPAQPEIIPAPPVVSVPPVAPEPEPEPEPVRAWQRTDDDILPRKSLRRRRR